MAQTNKAAPERSRPAPPEGFVDPELLMLGIVLLRPAPEVGDWIQRTVLAGGGPLHNPDHAHLIDADVAFLWASGGFAKQGRVVLGQAEQVMFRGGGWQKARQEQQMIEWFGRVPAFLITLAADYCAACSDAEFCALVEHELYRIAQELDEFGVPKFRKDGSPKLALRGHDVEEFVGVVRRYGASQDVRRLVDAANKPAEVGDISIARACGTCLRVAAGG